MLPLSANLTRRALFTPQIHELLYTTDTVQRRWKATTKQTKSVKPVKASDNRSAQTKGYLKKASTGKSATSSGPDRTETIRKMLYEQETGEDQRLDRLSSIIPTPEFQETIHRAWQLRLRINRDRVKARLESQYASLDRALEALRTTDVSLYLRTLKDSDGGIARLENVGARTLGPLNATGKLPGLFPRQMRIPTETEPVEGKVWDHDWRNPVDPLDKALPS